METIKNYLEAMFANMPNTPEVIKAKSELLTMMEDKYNELIKDGSSENAAVGTVISEFGNLDDLAEDLGLSKEVTAEHIYNNSNPRRLVTLDEAKAYVKRQEKSSLFIGIGVLLCILSVVPPIITDGIRINDGVGVALMFIFIGVAVGLFIYNGITNHEFDFIKKIPCQIDMNTANYLSEARKVHANNAAILKTVGIVLCVICWLPAALLSEIRVLDNLIGASLFILVGIGVFLIVSTSISQGAYKTLLTLNDVRTISGTYAQSNETCYINDTVATIMSVFWPSITCIYLAISFLTFAWYITWIIWPVAAIIHAVLKTNLVKEV